MLTIKVFLSSPGDVVDERRLAVETMRALEDGPLLRDRVNLQVVAWDDPAASAPLDARETPQASVNRWAGRPADCDLTLVILWSRLGTPLPASLKRADGSRFASGTVWEVEDAIAANRPVFIYRRTEKPRIELDDPDFDAKRAQYDAVRHWFDGLRDADGAWRSGVNEYATPAQFQPLLRAHLEAFIGSRLEGRPAAEPVPEPRPDAAPRRARAAAHPPPTAAQPGRRGWVVAGIGGLVALGAVAWGWRSGSAPVADLPTHSDPLPARLQPAAPDPSPPPPAATVAPLSALPQVRLAGPSAAKFDAVRGSTYSVLALTPEAGTAERWRLRLRVRLAAGAGSGGMNFWDSSFRLLVDGVPRAPESRLNEIVESGAAKDGDIVFSVPWAVQSLALQVRHYNDSAELPLSVSDTRPPQPVTLPTGPRHIALDGPAELTFPRSPRATYTVLALGTEARRPGVYALRLRVRMRVFDSYDATFGDSHFRLLVDGVPREPDSGLNQIVAGAAADDGDITFEVPDSARQLALRVIHSADLSADVPLKLGPAK